MLTKRSSMELAEDESSSRLGSVKAAVNLYGEKLLRENTLEHEAQSKFRGNAPSKIRELHLAKNDISRLVDSRRLAESVKGHAVSELSDAMGTVKDLSLLIEESSTKAKTQKKDMQRLRKPDKCEDDRQLAVNESNNIRYMEVMKELELVKRELLKLKLDMVSLREAKLQAERQASSSISREQSHWSSIEALRKEIEETTEEEGLVELAKMEAAQEFQAIEAEREAKAAQFSSKLEETRKRMKDIAQEINQTKDLEKKLEITNSDISMLEEELMAVKATSQKSEPGSSDSLKQVNDLAEEMEERKEEKSATFAELESALTELNDAKKELHTIKQEGFKFMASMDVIREELKHVHKETARLRKVEDKSDSAVQNLNSKLLRAKSKLEAAGAGEEKARSILSNLMVTLHQLETEKEAGKKEKVIITEELLNIKQQIQKMESDIELEEDKLQVAMHELEAAKRSEAMALNHLKIQTEKTMCSRASSSAGNSTIIISNFEYEYLTRQAEVAEEVADRKVAAAQAWIEALKAGEKEILIKTKIAHREIEEFREVEEQELYKTQKALSAERAVQSELFKHRQERNGNEENMQPALTTKSIKENGVPMTPRRSKYRRTPSPGFRHMGRSNSITLRKNRKVMPNLVKFFSGNKARKW